MAAGVAAAALMIAGYAYYTNNSAKIGLAPNYWEDAFGFPVRISHFGTQKYNNFSTRFIAELLGESVRRTGSHSPWFPTNSRFRISSALPFPI